MLVRHAESCCSPPRVFLIEVLAMRKCDVGKKLVVNRLEKLTIPSANVDVDDTEGCVIHHDYITTGHDTLPASFETKGLGPIFLKSSRNASPFGSLLLAPFSSKRLTALVDSPRNHRLKQFFSFQLLALVDNRSKCVINKVCAIFVYVNVNTSFLCTICSPKYSGC